MRSQYCLELELGFHPRVVAVLKLPDRFDFLHAGGDDDGGDVQVRAGPVAVCFQRHLVVADVALHRFDPGAGEHLDLRVGQDLRHLGLHDLRGRAAVMIMGKKAERVQEPAQLRLFFHDEGVETLGGDAQRGIHPGHSAADDQAVRLDRQPDFVAFLEQRGLGDPHLDEVLGFLGRDLRLAHVHPGDLLADAHELQQIRVDAGFARGALEERLVRAGGAGCHHHAIDPVLLDLILHPFEIVHGAGPLALIGPGHVVQGPGVRHHLGHVHDPGDVRAAVADKDTDADVVSHSAFPTSFYSCGSGILPRSTRTLENRGKMPLPQKNLQRHWQSSTSTTS